MNRRKLILSLAAASGGLGFKKAMPTPVPQRQSTFAIDGHHVRFYHAGVRESFSIFMLADTHLFRDDERGVAYQSYSGRMAKAYNQTRHFQTLEVTHPEACFEKTLALAAQEKARLVALIGDIFSFPSEAAIEWAADKLEKAGLRWLYVAGNHDWHYEGMEGSSNTLRDTWIRKRLLTLYNNESPYAQRSEINGVIFITIDNSTYEINAEQLSLLQSCLKENKPCILLLHIPLYAPGRPVSFGCGHPEWNAANDKNTFFFI